MQLKKKKSKILNGRFLTYSAVFALMISIMMLGGAQLAIPDQVRTEEILQASGTNEGVSYATQGEYTAKLLGVLPAKKVSPGVPENLTLVPCGDVFGVKFFTKGVLVIGVSDLETEEGIISPSGKAGFRKGDVITKADGKEINTAEELSRAIEKSQGQEMTFEFLRDDARYRAKLTPKKALSDSKYKTGMWVRDSTAGIGTITFYNPEDGSFAGLGHGICDSDTGVLMPILRGAVVDITLNDIIKGRDGHPGELKGSFGTEKKGSVTKNTACGISGVLTTPPETVKESMPAAMKSETVTGDATILCNVDGKGVREYQIEIVKIYSGDEPTKNFVIEVTDPTLINLTGGIVQGMSGSPILQNGKIVGAVTHVLVNDPTRGYGIFIENMLGEI